MGKVCINKLEAYQETRASKVLSLEIINLKEKKNKKVCLSG